MSPRQRSTSSIIKLNSLEKGWIESLASGETDLVLSAIYEIRNSGSVKILPYLFDMINTKTPYIIRTEILNLMAEIKTHDAVPVIVSYLEKRDFGEYLPSFIAACWQSGLDFSQHLRIFAEIFIKGDYIASLESFTLIEEAFPNATDDARMDCIRYIRESEYLVMNEKMPLYRELRKVMERGM